MRNIGKIFSTSLIVGGVLAASLAIAGAASAGQKHWSKTFHGKNGGSATITRDLSRQPGERSRRTSITTSNGFSRENSVTERRDRDAGTASRSRNRSTTFRDGTSRFTNMTATRDRASQSRTRSVERGYRDGTTASRRDSITRVDKGVFDVSRERTNRQGITRSWSGTFTRN